MLTRFAAVLACACLGTTALAAPAPAGPADVNAIAGAVLDHMWVSTDRHWHKGEYNHIVNLSRMIVAGRPAQLDAYGNAGWLLWSMDRDAEAVDLYKQGARANPKSYFLFNELGFYYAQHKRDFAAGLPWYEKAAATPDCPAFVLHMLAHCYEKTGQLPKALAVWTRAAKDTGNPSRAAAIVNRNRVQRLVRDRGAAQ